MADSTYTILFQKLEEALRGHPDLPVAPLEEAGKPEMDEIAELRRMVMEITEPEATSYTNA